MKIRILLAGLSSLLIIACSVTMPISPPVIGTTTTATQTPYNAPEEQKPTYTPPVTDTAIPWIVITGNVRVRTMDGSDTGSVLLLGDTVQAVCDVDYCYITSGEYAGYKIWRGCTSDDNGLGCESK